MRIKSAIGSVVGQTDNSHWGQVLLTPQAYGIVEILDSDADARQHGVRLLTEITHKCTPEVLSLQTLAHIGESTFDTATQTLGLLVSVGHIVYIVLRGTGRVYLKRGEKLATLIEGTGAISGELKKGDTILMVSKGFTDAISHEKLISVFDHLPPQDIAEKLTLLLHEATEGFGAAALVFQAAEFIPEESTIQETRAESQEVSSVQIPLKRTQFTEPLKHFISTWAGRPLRRMQHGSRKDRLLGLVAAAAIIIFFISVVLGIRKQTQGAQNTKLSSAMADARFAFDEGTSLLELNAQKGRERLQQAKNLLEPFLAKTPEKSQAGRDLRSLYADISQNLTQAMKLYRVTPELFYDVALLKKGAVASAIAASDDTLGILDRTTGTVYTVSLTTKSGEMVASGAELTGAMALVMDGDLTYAETDQGIVRAGGNDKKPALVIPKPDQWKVPTAITTFDGNVYVLDTGAGRIWKYIPSGNSFSDTREYLNPDAFPDLSHATSIAVDGSVWIGTTSGNILKFTQGREETFQATGIDPPFSAAVRVITDDTMNNLYVLDIQGKRIVVLAKDGTYIAQYAWDESKGIADFAVSEKARSILLVSEGKIFAIPLQ